MEWFYDRNSDHPLLDSATEQSLRDSGRYENGLKVGLWREYSVDSSLMGVQTEVQFGQRKSQMIFSAKFIQSVGSYSGGVKEGTWTDYTTDNVRAPFYWRRQTVTNFKGGKKDGQEVMYQGYLDQTPLIVRNWTKGEETGIGEIYDSNYPYALKQRTKIVDGVVWVTET